jgi:hypothetical protein
MIQTPSGERESRQGWRRRRNEEYKENGTGKEDGGKKES